MPQLRSRPCSESAMGCTPSGSVNKNKQDQQVGPEVLETYLRLERDIWREEQAVPAPALNHAMVRLEAAGADLSAAEQHLQRFTRTGSTDESLKDVIHELGVDRDPSRAQEHEEFIANINRQALARGEVALMTRRQNEAEEEVKIMTAKVNFLQRLYQQQDSLLGALFGEAYGSEEEKRLELELDKLRSYRDTLAGGELEWSEAAALVKSATELLDRAMDCWARLDKTNADTRYHLLTESRNSLQEAALAVQAAQALLPGVQFPYCSPRELTAVLQAVVYVFTDVQEPPKADHARRCYSNFRERARALSKWIDETIQSTLQKDLQDVDRLVSDATASLRGVRVDLIRGKMGGAGAANGVSTLQQSPPVPTQQHTSFPQLPSHERAAVPARRLNHSAMFSAQAQSAGQSQLYGPGVRDKGFAGDRLQKEFQQKLAARRQVWSPRKLEEQAQLNYWRPDHQ